ncbi:GNAT family N-acetyltransferase [Propionibacteriaceae bacterium Y2011]|uniref:GNAT family N-acetyltransferase n=1 Tax=Microlunatus sp. Y2014 TaxID=3418488 RepID=UPI003B4D12F2
MAVEPTTRAGARVLTPDDLYAVVRLLLQQPVHNVFVSGRIRAQGLDPFILGCPVWGFERDGELVALCHAGSNLVPIGAADAEVMGAFAELAGPVRRASSISGDAHVALALWHELCRRWGGSWQAVREVRERQPLMVIDRDPDVEPDPRVQVITPRDLGSYFDAAVRMYTEEVGVSPLQPSPSAYRSYVRNLVEMRRAFGVVTDRRVIFKSDLGSVSGEYCQVQGVWLDPELRGRGLAPALVARVVELARLAYPTVSLYVNDFNERAVATYRRVGFEQIGEFATILY